jgi:glucosamine--fructose-6-phosphate aminotransferase (isomerizing)
MMLLALKLARLKGMSKEAGSRYITELQTLPAVVEGVLLLSSQIERLANRYKEYRNFFLIGRQHMCPTCLEGALKLKEITYFESSAYPAGEMKHGPIALISPEHPTIALCGNALTFDKLLSNLMEIRSRGGPILAFAPKGSKEIYSITSDVIEIPGSLSDLFTPIPYAVGTQILAYHIAKLHHRDIDQPRNLAKSVTVE